MSIRTGAILLAGALILLSASCAKLPERPLPEEGDVTVIDMPSVDHIPAGWGDLKAVTVNSNVGHIYHLWFQNEAGDLHVAFYNIRTNSFLTDGRVIPRSQEDGS